VKVEVNETGEWKRELLVEVPVTQVQEMKQVVLRELRKKIHLPGFRKGKVPEDIIVRQFAYQVDRELVNRLVPKAYREAIAETKLDPLAPGAIRDVEYHAGEPLTFAADVEIRPVITIDDFNDLELVKRTFEVPEEDVETTIDALREKNATWESADRPGQDGDKITLELRDITDGPSNETEETEITVGAPGMLPEFLEAMTGIRVGEEKTVDITYPQEMEREELRGLHRKFHLKATGIAEKKLPAFDETFATQLGYASVEELRRKIREGLENEEEARAQRELEETAIEQMIQRNKFEAPDAMVRGLLQNVAEEYRIPEAEREAFMTSQRAAGERHVKRLLIVDAIAKGQDLIVGEDEVEAAVRAEVSDEREAAKALRKARQSGELERIRHRLRERKALDFLLGKAEIEEVRGPRPPMPSGAAG
jgi:trigger factor